MAESAAQIKFITETVMGFEKRASLTLNAVTTAVDIKGLQATFLVADSLGKTAVTRGNDGDIPTSPPNLNQYTATLSEWHHVPTRTGFNIYTSQGDGVRLMQEEAIAVLSRKRDDILYTELGNATQTWGAAAVATLERVSISRTKLSNAFAMEDEPWGFITPAFREQLMALKEFSSADYIKMKPFESSSLSKAFNWNGVNWIVDAGLPGTGTASASCFMFAKKAVGSACDTNTITAAIGYDSKNDTSWARVTNFLSAKILQNSGIIKMPHDDSTLS